MYLARTMTLIAIVIVFPAATSAQVELPFQSTDLTDGVKITDSDIPELLVNDIISAVGAADRNIPSFEVVTNRIDLLRHARAVMSGSNEVSVMMNRGGIFTFANFKLAEPSTNLQLPFAGGAGGGGVRVTASNTSNLVRNDVIAFVANLNHNQMSAVSNYNELLTKSIALKSASNHVAVYLKNDDQWVNIALVGAPSSNKLGFDVDPVTGGLEVHTSTHAEIKNGDVIKKVSIPDNLGFYQNIGVRNVSTKAELLDALDDLNDATSNQVSIYIEHPNRQPRIVTIEWK